MWVTEVVWSLGNETLLKERLAGIWLSSRSKLETIWCVAPVSTIQENVSLPTTEQTCDILNVKGVLMIPAMLAIASFGVDSLSIIFNKWQYWSWVKDGTVWAGLGDGSFSSWLEGFTLFACVFCSQKIETSHFHMTGLFHPYHLTTFFLVNLKLGGYPINLSQLALVWFFIWQ